MFQTTAADKIKTHILYSINLFRKPRRLRDNVEKIWYIQSGDRRHYNTTHALCMLDN